MPQPFALIERRLVDDLIADLFGQLSAIFIVGPRAAGKTTTAARYARTVVHLDREAVAMWNWCSAAGFRSRPYDSGDAFLAGIVFHTGPRTFALGEQITAVPISALWPRRRA